MSSSKHWDEVYARKGERVSWFRPALERSLAIVDGLGLGAGARAIDVGAGSSTLVDGLLDRGFEGVSVVDLSEVALERTRARLGARAEQVEFIVGDITEIELPVDAYDLWHDRAVFHFLTDPEARAAYVRQILRAVRPGGHVIVATFAPEGPEQCSELPVARYDERTLHAELGEQAFTKLGHERELHETPWGAAQEFVYCYCRCDAC